jgi:hypothetical protein
MSFSEEDLDAVGLALQRGVSFHSARAYIADRRRAAEEKARDEAESKSSGSTAAYPNAIRRKPSSKVWKDGAGMRPSTPCRKKPNAGRPKKPSAMTTR